LKVQKIRLMEEKKMTTMMTKKKGPQISNKSVIKAVKFYLKLLSAVRVSI
jgi:hypothetical protein